MVDPVQVAQPAPNRRRLLARLCLFAFCGGLLLILTSRPAEAAERRESGLLDPVSTTLKATAREVELAGRATGSGTSSASKVAGQARQAVMPQSRPAAGAARPAPPAVKRGTPAVTSPVRRVAPPTRPVTTATRTATRSAGAAAKPVTGTLTGSLTRAGKLSSGPLARAAKVVSPVTGVAAGPLARVARAAAPVTRVVAPVADVVAPMTGVVAPVTGAVVRPLGPALAPVGSALAPVAETVDELVPPVVPGGLLPLPGLPGSGAGSQDGPVAQGPGVPATGVDGTDPNATFPAASQTNPVRPAADGASSPAARSTRSWPALTGAVSLPGSRRRPSSPRAGRTPCRPPRAPGSPWPP